MAIYHLSVKTISRSAGRSATAAAAYRAGVSITDERTGEIHDYTRKGGVESAALILPANAPEWATDRAALWNAAEKSETRKNSTVAREFEVALPAELSPAARQSLAHDFARALVERHGCAADVAIHAPGKEGDNRNHHAHILLTTRRLGPEGFGVKTRELDDRSTKEVDGWRERFATLQNERLTDAGVQVQVDHRSLAAQGIERAPTQHLGPSATSYERRTGEPSDVRIRHQLEAGERLARAKELGELERESRQLDRSIIDLSGDLKAAVASRDYERDSAASFAESIRVIAARVTAEKREEAKIEAVKVQAERDRVASFDESIRVIAARVTAEKLEAAKVQAAQTEAQKWQSMAQSFAKDTQAEALKKYPELVHTYAFVEAVKDKAAREGYRPDQVAVVATRVMANVVTAVAGGQLVTAEAVQQMMQSTVAEKAPEVPRQVEPAEPVDPLQAAAAIMARWNAAVLVERAAHLAELTRRAESEVAAARESQRAHLVEKPLLFGRDKWEQRRQGLDHHLHRKQLDLGQLKDGTYPFVGQDREAVQKASEQRVSDKTPELARSARSAFETLQTEAERLERLRQIEARARQDREYQERERRRDSDSGRSRGRGRGR